MASSSARSASPLPDPRRRSLVQAGGAALVIAFAWPGRDANAAPADGDLALPPPKTVDKNRVDAFLRFGADGQVTVFTGKVDLGTGIRTALAQLVADELDVGMAQVQLVMGDTATTVDQWLTAGSLSISVGGVELRKAAATARRALLEAAARELAAPVSELEVQDGRVSVRGVPARSVAYGAVVQPGTLEMRVDAEPLLKTAQQLRLVGKGIQRVDIPAKVSGEFTYMQDFRLPGMLHARIVRPVVFGARVLAVDDREARRIKGFVRAVRKDNFLAVVARSEWAAVKASRVLKVQWSEGTGLPPPGSIFEDWRNSPVAKQELMQNQGDAPAVLRASERRLAATYEFPVQTHASIGPSCAVATLDKGALVVWTASQGPHSLRDELAGIVKMPVEAIRVIYLDGAGCYGRNGHEDAAADAALLATLIGQPVRVQWMRADETGRSPKTPPRVIDLEAAISPDGAVSAWNGEFYISTNSVVLSKPFDYPLLAATETGVLRSGNWVGSLHLNSAIPYRFPVVRVNTRQIATTPFRSAHLRSPGRIENSFANESFIDEVAHALRLDPAEFRRRHIDDPRGLAVLQAVLRRAGWVPRTAAAKPTADGLAAGRGLAYVRYNTNSTYVAGVADLTVDLNTGEVKVQHIFIAHDCGRIVNPDGVANQVEGGVLQAVSRTLMEAVQWNTRQVNSIDWASYPILRAPNVPRVEVELIDRPTEPSFGAGEAAGTVVPAALANAVFDATGARVRSVPLTAEKVKALLERLKPLAT
ncbi:MAG TPA: molybdopterin cofactor-binding domain-containing protein [Ideonella sp.]|nr:molybdopterin cofactor-binding domain-containing protein [Ideonella sp.]